MPTFLDDIRAATLDNPQYLPPFPANLVAPVSSEVELDDLLFDSRHIIKGRLVSICLKKLYVDFLVAGDLGFSSG
jgi:hypothetical protein